jgi:hypothetical protein
MKYLDSIPTTRSYKASFRSFLWRAKSSLTDSLQTKATAFLIAIFFLSTGLSTFAQLTPTVWNFNANSTGWTGNFSRSTLTNATMCGTAGMRRNLYSFAATGNLVSPIVPGTNNGGLVTIAYKYKAANYSSPYGAVNPWGSFNVQYGATATGPWTTIATVSQETQTGSCISKSHTFTPPLGNVFIKFDCFWTAGDYYLSFDDVEVVSQGAAPSCFAPTAIATTSLSQTSATLSWTAPSPIPTSGYEFELRTSGSAGSGSSGLALSGGTMNTNYSFAGLTANTNYTLYIRSNCGGSDLSSWGSGTFYTGYCVSTSTSSANGHISSFATVGEVQDITNNATGGSVGGYADYSSQAVMAAPGDAVNFTASINSSSGFRIWVDYNNDLVFADPAERVYASGAYVTSVNNSFTIPVGTAPGSYRMRIRSDWNSTTPAACGNISAGETEDYTLTVVGPCSAAPNAPTVTATAALFCQGGATVLNGSAFGPYSGFTHQWKSATTAGGPYSIVVPP